MEFGIEPKNICIFIDPLVVFFWSVGFEFSIAKNKIHSNIRERSIVNDGRSTFTFIRVILVRRKQSEFKGPRIAINTTGPKK